MKRRYAFLIIFISLWGLYRSAAQHVTVYNDTVCDNQEFGVLRTNIQGVLTSAYETVSIPFEYDDDFSNAHEVRLGDTIMNVDDKYSNPIPIGFNFYFFGEPYSMIVVGSNGDLIFQPGVSQTYDSWGIEPDELIPDITLPYYEMDWWTGTSISYGSIMGAYHDMDVSKRVAGLTKVTYELRGTAPNREFIITFHEVPQFDCNDLHTSQQIVLHENNYAIDVRLKHKPVCEEWNDGLAVVGIQNDDASCGYYPGDSTSATSTVNRNTSVFEIDSTQNPEAWRFQPAETRADITINWYDASRQEVPGEHADSLVVPLDQYNGPYTCEVTYETCDGTGHTEYDEGEIVTIPSPVINLGEDQTKCNNETIVLDATPQNIDDFQGVTLTYTWYRNNEVIDGANGPTYTVTEPGTYAVEVSSGSCTSRDEVVIDSYRNGACIIPQVITPNGDNKNDAFVLDYLNDKYGIESIEIFNRWGSKVYEKTDGYTDEWHGQGKSGKVLPPASYFYVIKLKNGEVKTGYVQIIN